jgi:hypothetical protein
VTNWFNAPYLIDLINSGQLQIPPFDIPVDQRFIYPEQRMHLYVPGSQKAVLNVIGETVNVKVTQVISKFFVKNLKRSCHEWSLSAQLVLDQNII